jgi:hypothetical protein
MSQARTRRPCRCGGRAHGRMREESREARRPVHPAATARRAVRRHGGARRSTGMMPTWPRRTILPRRRCGPARRTSRSAMTLSPCAREARSGRPRSRSPASRKRPRASRSAIASCAYRLHADD